MNRLCNCSLKLHQFGLLQKSYAIITDRYCNSKAIMKYRIEPMPTNPTRFHVVLTTGEILDAQGYGYKTVEGAKKAYWFEFCGGKEYLAKMKGELK